MSENVPKQVEVVTLPSIPDPSVEIVVPILSNLGGTNDDVGGGTKGSSEEATNVFACPICLQTIIGEHPVTLPCGHKFCLICLSLYIEKTLLDPERADVAVFTLILKCPLFTCQEQFHIRYLETAVAKHFQRVEMHFAIDLLLEKTAGVLKCANYICTRPVEVPSSAITVDGNTAVALDCPRCGTQTCARCSRLHHQGLPCVTHANSSNSQSPEVVDNMVCYKLCACKRKFCEGCPEFYKTKRPQPIPMDENGMRHGKVDLEYALKNAHRDDIKNYIRRFTCPFMFCGKSFKDNAALEAHVNETSEHEVWVCCKLPFLNKDEYRHHRLHECMNKES